MHHPQTAMNPVLNDPVTKAVMDNIMGNLPTKKPLVRCEDCDLCFTSQTVLDAHLQGARHAKQIRSKVIMATLEETKVAFSADQEANGLKCNICNVCLNSIQQLQTHLNGNRHKKKSVKGGSTPTEEMTECSAAQPIPSVTTGSFITTIHTPPAPPIRNASLSCQLCNKFFNSKAQYDVHISSKKHTQKITGIPAKNKKKRFAPFVKKKRDIFGNQGIDVIPSLANNFISGGYANS